MSDLNFERLVSTPSDDRLEREMLEAALRDAPAPAARAQALAVLESVTLEPSSGADASASRWGSLAGRYAGIGTALVALGITAAVVANGPTALEKPTRSGSSVPSSARGSYTAAANETSGTLSVPTLPSLATTYPTTARALPTTEASALPSVVAALPPAAHANRGGTATRPTVLEAHSSPTSAMGVGSATDGKTRATKTGATRESTLGREIVRMQAARSALAGGEPARALQVLDDYDTEFPSGTFSVEVSVLRIEALARDGKVAEVTRLGDRFLAQHPDGAFARRVVATLRSVAPSKQDSAPALPRN